jgi:hypothetical protein
MRKLLAISLLASNVAFAANSSNIAGTYQCLVHSHTVFHSTVTYILDPINTNFSKGYSTYLFKGISQYGTTYVGEAIANGNTLAIFNKNADTTKPNDYSVEVSTITHGTDQNGNPTTILHNTGYGTPSAPKSVFFITCIKNS